MMRRSLSGNLKTGINISILLFTVAICGLNFTFAQMNGIPDGTAGGIPDGRIPPGGLAPSGMSDASRNPAPPPFTSAPGQPNPQIPPGDADLPPTLGGSQSTGFPTSGRQEDSEFLKSVQDKSHPLDDFITVISRVPGNAADEKEVYLYEVLSGVTSSAHRRELLKAYWNLSEKMMQCHVRLAQRQWLQYAQNSLQAEQLPTDEIELAFQLVTQQCLALEAEFIQAQYRFLAQISECRVQSVSYRSQRSNANDTAPSPLNSPLPIPADFPLAVPYNTKIEEIRKTRTLSQKSLLLGQTIPLQYKAIVARTAARQTAMSRWQTVLTKYRQSPVTQLEALAQEEMALIRAIIEYNHQVDEYVIETFGTNIPEKQLLAAILVLPKRPTAEAQQTPNRMPSTYIE